ncbi:hypothetical protein [Guptibacillus hwajinpoensis]|uniref:Uncharacterized protein n=1 Tax=Guptibacillus hwajinpoensis TaxID=208199 RepID=A0A0J6CSB6_9BACL|nr:hypothetical protein [Alkalihalobacillus macyae]KMM39176.1 hypothetical protein AB986_08100 [Alkalihalobacillus macyae]
MNSNGFARGLLAKHYNGEKFLLHVADVIERQLKEWSVVYEVMVMKLSDYKIVVKKDNRYYELVISEKELDTLQATAPFALDRFVWKELEKQGIEIVRGYGDYIERVM